jgi:thiol-disulfide isomerase/thioredoxin
MSESGGGNLANMGGAKLDGAKNFLKNNSKTIMLVIFASALFIGAAYYVYQNFVKKKVNPTYVENKEFINEADDSTTEADLYFFYTDWCPHSKKALPEWNKFKESIGTGKVNGHTINFFEVDCDKDAATADKFKVENYPTIKLVVGNQIIEYDAKPNTETLTQFLQTTLK